ncbi:concanavalin A-like lectin/glucanase domain-containing protein [Ganoderma leucocontextum]|nr:concanavalin A-like lectin/glucanase domain-containing protein [Ganoderma leucocontextum]
MRAGYAFFSLASLLIPLASADSDDYFFKTSFLGRDFLEHWTWYIGDDPTHGRVNYVDQATALQHNLSYASDYKFVMRADSVNVINSSDPKGRNSVRMQSVAAYSDAIIILDLQHMPEGCATWPAFWSVSAAGPWPKGGEIDIIEGVNLDDENLSSLHTSENCTMAESRFMSGNVTSTDCNADRNENQGCGVQFRNPLSYGALFNKYDGGYYVMARTKSEGIRVCAWEIRHPPTSDLFGPAAVAPTALWGQPAAVFEFGAECSDAEHFDAHNLVFDLTFCGDWAGDAYATSGCPGTSCGDFVDGNPAAFKNAYWEINAMHIYTPA